MKSIYLTNDTLKTFKTSVYSMIIHSPAHHSGVLGRLWPMWIYGVNFKILWLCWRKIFVSKFIFFPVRFRLAIVWLPLLFSSLILVYVFCNFELGLSSVMLVSNLHYVFMCIGSMILAFMEGQQRRPWNQNLKSSQSLCHLIQGWKCQNLK